MTLLVLLTIAWGAFAFGAVYPWAYGPMFAAAAAIGLAGLLQRQNRYARLGTLRPTAVALALLAAYIGAQLLPLPRFLLATISPAADSILLQQDIAYAGGLTKWHALSIDPGSTMLSLAAFVALALLTIGLARALHPSRVVALVQGITAIGLALTIAALVQRSTGTLKIYGFWSPIHHPYQIYGPFVNHNHFAGWMLMAIPLVLGAVIGEMARTSGSRRTWRSRVLWIDTPEGSRVAFMVIAALAMGVALVLTLSRSGIAVFSMTIVLLGIAVVRARATSLVALAAVAIVAISVFSWTGIEAVERRFATGESITGRLPGWRGAMSIAADFPVFGSGINTYKNAMLYHNKFGPSDKIWDAAHNDYLQVVSEGGLLVVILIAFCMWQAVRQMAGAWRVEPDPRMQWIRLGAIAGLFAIGVQAFVDFSLQIRGNAAFFAVVFAIALHEPRVESSSRRRRVIVEPFRPGGAPDGA